MSELPVESVREVRAHLAAIVERADRDATPTVITRRGREVAAVVPIDLLRDYRAMEEREIQRIIAERRGEATVSLEEVMSETLARPE
jgi:prevent-host-death family protein